MNFPAGTRSPTNPMGGDATLCAGPTTSFTTGPAAKDLGINQVALVPGASVPNLCIGRDSQGVVVAFELKCTHLNCTGAAPPLGSGSLAYVADQGIWRCGCHGSTYTVTGALIQGQKVGQTSLRRYNVCKGSDGLYRIDLSKSF